MNLFENFFNHFNWIKSIYEIGKEKFKELNPMLELLLGTIISIVGAYLNNWYVVSVGIFIGLMGAGACNIRENIIYRLHHLTDSDFFFMERFLRQGKTTISIDLEETHDLETAIRFKNWGIFTSKSDQDKINEHILRNNKDKIENPHTYIKTYVGFEMPLFLYKYILKNKNKLFRYTNEEKTEKEYLLKV